MNKRVKRMAFDFFMTAAILVFAGLAFLLFKPSNGSGDAVIVKHNGSVVAVMSLNKDEELDVDGLLTVVVENGGVYVKGAVCKDKLCQRHSRIYNGKESIICLPNSISVEITSVNTSAEIDFIV